MSVGFSLIFLLENSLFVLNELPDILGYLREIVNTDLRDPILFQFILSPQSSLMLDIFIVSLISAFSISSPSCVFSVVFVHFSYNSLCHQLK